MPIVNKCETWQHDDTTNDKLIDLDTSKNISCDFKSTTNPKERADGNGFTTSNFDNANDGDIDYKENSSGESLSFKTSFEQLQKATRDLDKRLHEGIVIASAEIGRCGEQSDKMRVRDESALKSSRLVLIHHRNNFVSHIYGYTFV